MAKRATNWLVSSPLLVILGIAFVLRVACLSLTGTIDSEGTEYARLAENLLAGKGYSGIATPGKDLMFPPLFPFLIAAMSFLTGSTELAGRLVSLTMGTLLVLPIYGIAQHLYERRAAIVAAAVTALHPLLVFFSTTVYCEPTYLTLLFTAVYWIFRGIRFKTARDFSIAGVWLGLAFLIRQEALAIAMIGAVIAIADALLAEPRSVMRVALRASCMPAVLLIFALPYGWWLHAQTGQWRLEGKSPLNYTTARQIMDGMPAAQAQYGVDVDLTERGVWIQPNQVTIQAATLAPGDVARFIARRLGEVTKFVEGSLTTGKFLGSPVLFVFAIVGLFRNPWPREHTFDQLFLVLTLVLSCVSLVFIYYVSVRFILVFAPIMIVWAANGILGLAVWASSTLQMTSDRIGDRPWMQPVFAGLLVAMLLIVPVRAAPGVYEIRTFDKSRAPVKVAGEWLNAYAPGEKAVVDTSTVLAFHARARFIPFPYAASETALRYLDKRGARFIILREGDAESRPYLKAWMDGGVPGPNAKLIYSTQAPEIGRILIYERITP